ncbi:hypothetical protein [Streptomyces sp. NPDC059759]|uniref:hypothetical protein n=1 Tax=Streptomyces sp. NPDC059759 TaxID=3346936 RepID=UPI00364F8DFD
MGLHPLQRWQVLGSRDEVVDELLVARLEMRPPSRKTPVRLADRLAAAGRGWAAGQYR